ncbi:MAG: hypothetical protein C4313_08920 [Thermoflexus sp.]|uniref:hypothetical protein n=1 Tax=Thermoflexus sp. TaxID=1969742 RepID=UPI00331EC7BB
MIGEGFLNGFDLRLVPGICPILILVLLLALLLVWIVRRSRPPREVILLYQPSPASKSRRLRPELTRSVALVGVGTFGTRLAGRLLTILYWMGLDELISGVLIVEHDAQQRMRFHNGLPSRRPPIHYAHSDAFDLGFANQPIPEVLEQIDRWGPPITQETAEFIDTILRRTGNRHPGLILAFLSLGGQAPLFVPILVSLNRRFPDTPIFVGTALPAFTPLRERFLDIKHRTDRIVWGWIMADNLAAEPVDLDLGMIALIVGAAGGALHEDTPVSLNNLLNLALPQRGGLLTYRFLRDELPAYYSSSNRQFFTYIDPVVNAVLTGLRQLDAGAGVPQARPPAHPGRAFDVVLANIVPEGMQRVADQVRAGIRARREILNQPQRPDYAPIFSTWALPIEARQPKCHILVLRIEGVDPGVPLEDIVRSHPASLSEWGVQSAKGGFHEAARPNTGLA